MNLKAVVPLASPAPPHVLRNAHSADNMILGVALQLAKDGAEAVILVTKDVNLRIRADAPRPARLETWHEPTYFRNS